MSNLQDPYARNVAPLDRHVNIHKATKGRCANHNFTQILLINILVYRGIPSGYISNLEQRLVETETALFEALSFASFSLGQGDNPQSETHVREAFTDHSAAQSKDEKVEEWKRLPLSFKDQRQAWLQERHRIANRKKDQEFSGLESVTSQGTEVSWMGSPLPQPAQHNGPTSQSMNDNRFLAHANDIQHAQDIPSDQSQTTMDEEQSLQNSNFSLRTQLEKPRKRLNDELLTGESAPWQNNDDSTSALRDEDELYDMATLVDNSNFVYGQLGSHLRTPDAQDLTGPRVSSSSPRDRLSSFSSDQTRTPREARQFSSKEWQKYF